jgi:hypothetical protein
LLRLAGNAAIGGQKKDRHFADHSEIFGSTPSENPDAAT